MSGTYTKLTRDMRHRRTLTDRIASSILQREGAAAIWNLRTAAASLHRARNNCAAAALFEIAEAAEAEWLAYSREHRDMRRVHPIQKPVMPRHRPWR